MLHLTSHIITNSTKKLSNEQGSWCVPMQGSSLPIVEGQPKQVLAAKNRYNIDSIDNDFSSFISYKARHILNYELS